MAAGRRMAVGVEQSGAAGAHPADPMGGAARRRGRGPGRSRVTTAPAPTVANRPTSQPATTTAPAPMEQPWLSVDRA